MSEENVDRARRAYEAFNRRDLDALLALVDPEADFTTRFVERSEAYHGHDGVRMWWDDLLRVFPDFSIEVVEVREVRDLTVNTVSVRGHGLGSETPVRGDRLAGRRVEGGEGRFVALLWQ
jgi:hypothetical protein